VVVVAVLELVGLVEQTLATVAQLVVQEQVQRQTVAAVVVVQAVLVLLVLVVQDV
jgi:hypothetical protein